jgi:chromosomal replication initiator protein
MFAVASHNTNRAIRSRIKQAEANAAALAASQLLAEFKGAVGRAAAELAEQQRREAEEVARKAEAIQMQMRRGFKMERIVCRICSVLGVSVCDVMSARRSRGIAFARQAICYWACRLTNRSLPSIGRYLGRDHTSVLHGKRAYVEKRAKMGRTLRSLR